MLDAEVNTAMAEVWLVVSNTVANTVSKPRRGRFFSGPGLAASRTEVNTLQNITVVGARASSEGLVEAAGRTMPHSKQAQLSLFR